MPQELAERSGLAPVFVATAEAWDDEMAARIRLHVDVRDRRWRTVESPYDLGAMLTATTAPGSIVLVDCLTLWLSNLLLRGDDIEDAGRTLANSVPTLAGAAVFVTNEVGAGIVPDTALGRRFRDAQGRLNQQMAAACRSVVQVTAGLPLQLKPRQSPEIVF